MGRTICVHRNTPLRMTQFTGRLRAACCFMGYAEQSADSNSAMRHTRRIPPISIA
jgi:hypothetical protein